MSLRIHAFAISFLVSAAAASAVPNTPVGGKVLDVEHLPQKGESTVSLTDEGRVAGIRKVGRKFVLCQEAVHPICEVKLTVKPSTTGPNVCEVSLEELVVAVEGHPWIMWTISDNHYEFDQLSGIELDAQNVPRQDMDAASWSLQSFWWHAKNSRFRAITYKINVKESASGKACDPSDPVIVNTGN